MSLRERPRLRQRQGDDDTPGRHRPHMCSVEWRRGAGRAKERANRRFLDGELCRASGSSPRRCGAPKWGRPCVRSGGVQCQVALLSGEPGVASKRVMVVAVKALQATAGMKRRYLCSSVQARPRGSAEGLVLGAPRYMRTLERGTMTKHHTSPKARGKRGSQAEPLRRTKRAIQGRDCEEIRKGGRS